MGPVPADPKLFTVQEAHKVLEEVRPLVGRLLRTFEAMREEIEAAAQSGPFRPDDPGLARHLETRGVAPRLLQEIDTVIQEIQRYGCVVNGPEAGLVDFPCLMGNEIVFLCWKFGEHRIGHWHRIPDGFAGRRALLETGEIPDEGAVLH